MENNDIAFIKFQCSFLLLLMFCWKGNNILLLSLNLPTCVNFFLVVSVASRTSIGYTSHQ